MKKLLLALAMLSACGCATITTRIMGGETITDTYQCTMEGIAWCSFITVPQVLNPGPMEWHWINIVSVPVGVCCFIVDVPIEFVCDTICYPYDKYRIKAKNKTAE